MELLELPRPCRTRLRALKPGSLCSPPRFKIMNALLTLLFSTISAPKRENKWYIHKIFACGAKLVVFYSIFSPAAQNKLCFAKKIRLRRKFSSILL